MPNNQNMWFRHSCGISLDQHANIAHRIFSLFVLIFPDFFGPKCTTTSPSMFVSLWLSDHSQHVTSLLTSLCNHFSSLLCRITWYYLYIAYFTHKLVTHTKTVPIWMYESCYESFPYMSHFRIWVIGMSHNMSHFRIWVILCTASGYDSPDLYPIWSFQKGIYSWQFMPINRSISY